MKLSYEELEQQLTESHCALRAETTAHENTQMQLEKMAAENAGLKEACGGDGSYRDCPACTHSEYIEAPETPATDAFLAEVRAQGVEMAIEHIEQTICPNHETILSEFADHIRKGGSE